MRVCQLGATEQGGQSGKTWKEYSEMYWVLVSEEALPILTSLVSSDLTE
jgi:hypothetical protein